jgi:hypothetical protein
MASDDAPDDAVIYGVVSMPQDVADPLYVFPGDDRMLLLHSSG